MMMCVMMMPMWVVVEEIQSALWRSNTVPVQWSRHIVSSHGGVGTLWPYGVDLASASDAARRNGGGRTKHVDANKVEKHDSA